LSSAWSGTSSVTGRYPAQAALLAKAANADLGLRATIISNERSRIDGSAAVFPIAQRVTQKFVQSGSNLQFYSAFSLYWAGTSGMDVG
jgi:hypothetical protein